MSYTTWLPCTQPNNSWWLPLRGKKISQEAACFDWEHPRCQKADVNLSIETKFTQRGTWAQTSPSPSKSLIYWKGRWKLELGDREDSFRNALQSASIALSTESRRLASCKNEWQIYASLWSRHSTRWQNPLRSGYGIITVVTFKCWVQSTPAVFKVDSSLSWGPGEWETWG